jgi:hypothetical protein
MRGSFKTSIFVRDGFRCVYCRGVADGLDHVIPFSAGGPDSQDNLVACCMVCNSALGDRRFDGIEAKRQFARERRRTITNCAICNRLFSPYRATNQYCRERCRAKAPGYLRIAIGNHYWRVQTGRINAAKSKLKKSKGGAK